MSTPISLHQDQYRIFSDGACLGNPGRGGTGTIVQTLEEIREFGTQQRLTTNNQMEIKAVIIGLNHIESFLNSQSSAPKPRFIQIYTDSTYVIKAASQWIRQWVKNNWKTADQKDVSNKELWLELLPFLQKWKIEFIHVQGHAGIPGNERCDEIASAFAAGSSVQLYQGQIQNYSVDLEQLTPSATKLAAKKKFSNAGKPAYSYLSLIAGVLMKHKTWAECEARVKGRAGAKFKKSLSPADESEIIKSWGMKP